MTTIATLTLNPTIDATYEVDRVFHTHKMRTTGESYDPGGGGINVARVFVRLGGNARCLYFSGGATGQALDGLLDLHQLARTRIAIQGLTRISSTVITAESGKEYRIVPRGPVIAPGEWQECLTQLQEVQCDYLVASGSLPPGVPEDFYARVVSVMAGRGIPVVLDSSGPGLSGGVAGGGLLLIKPSIGELKQLTGRELNGLDAVAEAAAGIVRSGQATYVAVTMGHEGALLAHAQGTLYVPALDIEVHSAVGAGDSFLAAMIFGLASGWDVEDALRLGVAAGSAAVLSPGSDLAHPEDIRRLYALIPQDAHKRLS